MTRGVFGMILIMSGTASLSILAVLLIRLCLKRAPKIFSYALWAVILFRLLCPISFASGISLIGMVKDTIPAEVISAEMITNGISGEEIQQSAFAGNNLTAAGVHAGIKGNDGTDNVTEERQMRKLTFSGLWRQVLSEWQKIAAGRTDSAAVKYGSYIWLTGLGGMAAYSLCSMLRMRRALRGAVSEEKITDYEGREVGNVYFSEVETPFVYGVLHPKIYLPMDTEERELDYILLHEQIHIKRGDHILRMAGFAALCLHWFNPLVWLAFSVSGKDMEMSCDEAVIQRIGKERKKEYSASLLSFAEGKTIVGGTPIGFGEGDTKSRIRNVLRYRKPTAWLAGSALTVCILSGIMLLANPKADGQAVVMPGVEATAVPGSESTGMPESEPTAMDGEEDMRYRDIGIAGLEHGLESKAMEGWEVLAAEGKISVFSSEELKDIQPAGEIFSQGELNGQMSGTSYQVYRNGIFFKRDEMTECVYPDFAGLNPQVCVFDGRLYFTTDKNYTSESLDWVDDAIRWVDLNTLESGLFLIKDTKDSHMLIRFFNIADNGFLSVSGTGKYGAEKSLTLVLPEPRKKVFLATDGSGLRADRAVSGESLMADKEEVGMLLGTWLRKNPAKLLDVSVRECDRTFAWLDLDGDGAVEEICLRADEDAQYFYDTPFDAYQLQVGEAVLTDFQETQANGLYAFCPDGKEIILALYSDGPSGDPETIFYAYREGKLQDIGMVRSDVRAAEFKEDGTFTGMLLDETVQTDWIWVSWRLGKDGRIEQVLQDVYEYVSFDGGESSLTLLVELGAQTEPGGGGTVVLTPQKIDFSHVTADSKWIEITEKDGTKGWIELEKLQEQYSDNFLEDVFANRYFAG